MNWWNDYGGSCNRKLNCYFDLNKIFEHFFGVATKKIWSKRSSKFVVESATSTKARKFKRNEKVITSIAANF